MEGIAGKVAIVTGAASGIGAGVVRRLRSLDCRVVATDLAGAALDGMEAPGDPALLAQPADLRSNADIERLVDATLARFSAIDFLILSACTYQDPGLDATREQWIDAFDVNVFGHVMLLKAALPALRRSGSASVVNFTTEAAHAGLAGRWVYPASKAAIEQVTRSQALDLAADGIRVNSVLHGWTRKPLHDTAPPEVRAAYDQWARRLHMIGRLGTLEEAADAVIFLCSEHASFVTGSCLQADGGHSSLGPQGCEVVLPTALRAAASRS